MQSKIEGLTTTNALMKEDLSICQNALFKSQEDSKKMLSQMGRYENTNDSTDRVKKVCISYVLLFNTHLSDFQCIPLINF